MIDLENRLINLFSRALVWGVVVALSAFLVLPFSGEFGWLGGVALGSAMGYACGTARAGLAVLLRETPAGGEP